MTLHKMAPVDAAWFHMDGRANLAMATSAMLTGKPLDFDKVKALYAARLAPFPRFRQRVVERGFPVPVPHWEDVPDFDIGQHMHHIALPQPRDRRALTQLLGQRGHRGAITDAVVESGHEGAAAVDAVDHMDLPQRLQRVERGAHEIAQQPGQCAPVARLRQRDVVHVLADVEVGHVLPVRRRDREAALDDPLPEARKRD